MMPLDAYGNQVDQTSYQAALANALQPQPAAQPQPFDPEGTGPTNYDPSAGPMVANLPAAAQAFGTSAVSGHATNDLLDWTQQNLPGQAHPVAGYATRAAMIPAVAGAMALDGYANSAKWGAAVQRGDFGTDVTDPASQAAIMPGAVQTAMAMGAPGMGMAEEGALGAAGGKAMTKAAPNDLAAEMNALLAGAGKKAPVAEPSLQDQMAALLDRPSPAPAAVSASANPFAAMHAALDAQPTLGAPRSMAETGIVDPSAASWQLHHGTDAAWDTFDPTKTGARTHGAEVGAMYMSPHEGEASTYANGDNARVLSLQVTPGNTGVYDVARMTATRDPRFMDALQQESSAANTSPAIFRDALDRYDRDVAYHTDLRARMPDDVRATMPDYPAMSNLMSPQAAAVRMAREDGRDTAILRGLGESSGGDQVVALRPGFVHDAATGRQIYARGLPGGAALAGQAQPQPDADTLHAALLAQAGGRAPRAPDPLLEAMMAARR